MPWEWDIASDTFRWGAAPTWLLGPLPKGASAHPDLRQVVHPEDLERFLAAGREAKASTGAYRIEFRVIRSDGTARDVLARGHAHAESGTRPTSIIGVIIDIEARKRAQDAAEILTAAQRALLDSLPDVTWLKNAQGHLTAVNRAFGERYGMAAEAAVGKTDFDIYPDDKALRLRSEDAQIMASRTPVRYESTQNVDGRDYWVEVVKAPIFDTAAKVIGTVGSSRDISARRAAERDLRDSEQRFRVHQERAAEKLTRQRDVLKTVIDNFPGGISLCDPDLRFTTYNDKFMELLDFPPSLFAKGWVDFEDLARFNANRGEYGPGDPEEQVQAVLARTKTFQAHRIERVRPNGRWLEIRGTPVASGGFVTSYIDITERKSMEASLHQALRQSEALLETTPTAIAVILDRVILRCNPAMERLFGAKPGELLGRSTRVLFASDADWEAKGKQVYEAIARGETFSGEHELVRQNGEHFWVIAAGRPIEPGSPQMLFAYTDVTAQQNLARALAAAKAAADAANKAKSGFLASMSHEIRTPMNGVLGMLELLELTELDSAQRETLALARDSAVSLLRLIDEILDFSKIEAGQLAINPEPVSLAALVNRAAGVYLELASRKAVLLECQVDPRIAEAHLADGLRVSQIVNNLLSNAIKFTAQGSVTLKLESAERGAGDELVRISVADTGIGVPPEHQGRLFQPFAQAQSDTTRIYGGTGLGLSICRRVAELMGGSIGLESEAGRSTTVTVLLRFPLADPSTLQDRKQARIDQLAAIRRRGREADAAAAAGACILIAEDHPVNLKLIQRQVALLGYATDLARDGAEALEKWKTGAYALLLTDCNMPRMDGYHLAREIRRIEAANETARPIPIIACTANALAGDAAVCIDAGMNDCLAKPITLPALQAKLAQWIDASTGATDASAPAGGSPRPAAPAKPDLVGGDAVFGEPPLDSITLDQFTGGDEDLRREILRDFLAANAADAAALREALAGEDLAAIARAAHRAKGASRMIGAQPFADVVERIEDAAWGENRAAVRGCVADFEREQSRLVKCLRAEIGEHQSHSSQPR